MSTGEGKSSYLDAPLTSLKGVGEKTAKLFNGLNIFSVEDLLRYYPRSYDIFEEPVPVMKTLPDTVVSVKCAVLSAPQIRSVHGRTFITFTGGDASGNVTFTYFNAVFLAKAFREKQTYIFRGLIKEKNGRRFMAQPKFYKCDEYVSLEGSMQPRYSLTKGLTNNAIIKAVKEALKLNCYTEESLPDCIIEKEHFLSLREALYSIHFPKDEKAFLNARKRLAFEEFYGFIIKLKKLKSENEKRKALHTMIEVADCSRLIQSLPYALTGAQQKAWSDVEKDMAGAFCMNRLLQGDVGSGKTIIALLALIMCAANGCQGAIMAPTAVLAAQHFEYFSEMQKKYKLPIKPVLLTGGLSAAEKRAAHELISSGERNVIIGTHALFQEKVSYKKLALVVTDEQHRFGVRQRDSLEGKGEGAHVLAMSATPIPRTLAIILYGDLDVSVIDEVPLERKPIKNAVVDTSFREKAVQLIVREVRAGHQAYIICPMIEPGEMDGLQNVTEYAQDLKERLPADMRVGVLHGRMKQGEKDRVMEEFALGRIDILVSTTVVEVGVNVPNATVMMIEDAQRFGLAQLHQLRGRVGRGEAQSYCIFVDTAPKREEGKESPRLSVMKKSNNGFEIAEEDLKQRGPGELFGLRQAGELSFGIADIYRDADLLTKAAAYAGMKAEV